MKVLGLLFKFTTPKKSIARGHIFSTQWDEIFRFPSTEFLTLLSRLLHINCAPTLETPQTEQQLLLFPGVWELKYLHPVETILRNSISALSPSRNRQQPSKQSAAKFTTLQNMKPRRSYLAPRQRRCRRWRLRRSMMDQTRWNRLHRNQWKFW